ncbi:hypothetical protein FC26_GL000127 [Paucilactobacillus vaccinostercus DSM 20634]|jgi:hypothetical protein|uniref:Uncharacterized protein n=1 Tax=Paucilactobacillus vaccinostercus DSM 20634 TaxID=1423813 RepID=A0A0R2A1B8_9LACO|nr:hypothetical protein [Paucilactobacillus vaccinostercus]KRM60958.1 hypothetical protein FC26_GL000127 [Paucilactobacillus vaccinostercus DSM 20634]RRG08121.1 MAG: hypothetical protein DUD32_11345 [Lactobacillus sp.]
MAKNQQMGTNTSLYKPNEVNEKYHDGEETLFYSSLTKKTAKGVIKKRYEHACLIDFSDSKKLSSAIKDELNSKIIVSYQALKPLQ